VPLGTSFNSKCPDVSVGDEMVVPMTPTVNPEPAVCVPIDAPRLTMPTMVVPIAAGPGMFTEDRDGLEGATGDTVLDFPHAVVIRSIGMTTRIERSILSMIGAPSCMMRAAACPEVAAVAAVRIGRGSTAGTEHAAATVLHRVRFRRASRPAGTDWRSSLENAFPFQRMSRSFSRSESAFVNRVPQALAFASHQA
jgi:hypothetical protein